MLTPRAWWFLLLVIVVLLVASLVPEGHGTLALIGLTLLLWFLAEWFRFAVQASIVVRRLRVERQVWDGRGKVDSLWVGRSFEVRVRLALPGWLGLGYVMAADRVPLTVTAGGGRTDYEGPVSPRRPVTLTYRIGCVAAGRVRFEGLSIKLADLQGLFYHVTFVPDVQLYRVLPVLGDVDGLAASSKRHNLLPPPGLHRQRLPGSGSELLDLRDYVPGDPPRQIAWKVSARRDKLITKEFESEVPVRCTLFVDTSHSVRLGPPGQNALARLTDIAARVARAAAGNRDPVGLCLFDEQKADALRPARGKRHIVDIMNRLADVAGLAPASGDAPLDLILPLGYSFAEEVYPDWLRPDRNSFPVWLAWLWPKPLYSNPRWTAADLGYRLFPWLLPVYVVGGLVTATVVWLLLAEWLRKERASTFHFIWILGLAALAMALFLLEAPRYAFRRRKIRYRWRKQLAAMLSVRHGLAPGGLALLLEDDELFTTHLQRFLAEHQVPYPLRLYDDRGKYLFASPKKVDVLAEALLRAVGKGHDNELFVLLADLLELDDLDPLLRAAKVAQARHHQVLVVCPWPPGLPVPAAGTGRQTYVKSPVEASPTRSASDGSSTDWTSFRKQHIEDLVRQTTTARFHDAFQRLRKTFARIGVLVVCAQDEQPARLIVERLDRLRTMRSAPPILRRS